MCEVFNTCGRQTYKFEPRIIKSTNDLRVFLNLFIDELLELAFEKG